MLQGFAAIHTDADIHIDSYQLLKTIGQSNVIKVMLTRHNMGQKWL